jgi:PEP-CTERM motif
MKKTLGILSILLLVGAIAAQASVVTLTFEGLGDQEQVLNYYDAGFGGSGSGPGPAYGITFGADSLSIISQAAGGSGNFDGAPTMPTILFFLTGPGDIMNVPAGFDTGFSFYYSSPGVGGSVTVYDQLGGMGNILATLALSTTPSGGPGCSGNYTYCPWVPVGVTFSGTAYSVNFSGTANYIGFDNITLGSGTPTPGIPEPGTLVMFGSGLAGLAGVIRRKLNV